VTALSGVVTSGLGHGAGFMALGWVRDGIRRIAGFDPYPGTFNVRLVDPAMVARWSRLGNGLARRLDPPTAGACGAAVVPVVLASGIVAAVIVPDVTAHAPDVLELVAPVHVRSVLGLDDGEPVTIELPVG
jgi:riboflavin kinase, archaea type